jgi:hypothetical protein
VALLLDAQRWCQGAAARDAGGQAVAYTDPTAAAWDITGAACRRFGLRRASALFVQIDCHLQGRNAAGAAEDHEKIAAMVALPAWNDDARTTHGELVARLQTLPVQGVAHGGPGRPAQERVPERDER